MNVSLTTVEISVVLFFATFARSTFGFGEALIAVPLLALLIPIQMAVPIAVLVSVTVASIVLLQDWRHVHLRSAGWLVASTLIGTPVGLLVLARVQSGVVKLCLGLLLLGFSTYFLLSRKRAVLPDDRLAWPFGLAAGLLGGAYGMNGPPLVLYGTLRGWSPQRFRATLQGYFLPASAAALAGYALAGLWTTSVTRYYLVSLPGVLVAIVLGRAVNARIRAGAFVRWVNLGLLIISLVLIGGSLQGVR